MAGVDLRRRQRIGQHHPRQRGRQSSLWGGGNDILNNKRGNDTLYGQAGADTFVFEHGTGVDTVGDFVAGTDKIDLNAIGYSWQQQKCSKRTVLTWRSTLAMATPSPSTA